MAKKQSFEDSISRLEQIVHTLEMGDTGLDQALKLFEEASKLSRQCMIQLDQAQQKVVALTKGPDGAPIESDFDTGAEE